MRFLTTEIFRGVPPGRVVILADDEVPSRFLIPLDELAAEALRKAKEAYVEDLAFRMSQLSRTSGLSPWRRERLLRIPAIPDRFPEGAQPEIDLRRPGVRRNRAADLRERR